jgi:hypothetical protein
MKHHIQVMAMLVLLAPLGEGAGDVGFQGERGSLVTQRVFDNTHFYAMRHLPLLCALAHKLCTHVMW